MREWSDEVKAEAKLAEVEGAMRADDKRLEDAAIRVWGEHRWGCDTPDQMADTILDLRAKLAEAQEVGRAFRKARLEAEAKLAEAQERIQKILDVNEQRLDEIADLKTKTALAEIDEWAETARSEMAGRRAAEAEVERANEESDRQNERADHADQRAEKAEAKLAEAQGQILYEQERNANNVRQYSEEIERLRAACLRRTWTTVWRSDTSEAAFTYSTR